MAYSDFTLQLLQERLGIEFTETVGAYESIPAREPTALLRQTFERTLPIALGANKEKGRSELLVSPVLVEVRELSGRQVSVFSGPEFNVEPKLGLRGFCDFLLARSPHQTEIVAPVMAIVEAKHEDLNAGIPQCLAEMQAARLFNEKRGNRVETVYGATTSGTAWRFLKLAGHEAEADVTEYHIREIEKILGILTFMVA
jgi:hypothetical protein